MGVSNYAKYLKSIYPDSLWDVARIPHGSINVTLKAIKTAGQAGPQSIVLKHASPFFEDEGELQPFALQRQKIEATMMNLWARGGLLDQFIHGPDSWRIPMFIRHEKGTEATLLFSDNIEECSIVLLEDLGEVVNLFKRIELWAQSTVSEEVDNCVTRIGFILGHSLAEMHSPETMCRINSSPEVSAVLSQSLTDDVVWYLSMDPFAEYVADIPKSDVYYQRLVKDIKNPAYVYPRCLVHGDFHFGNIMLPLASNSKNGMRPAVIDWEFANSNGRGANGDISEFLSLLHCRIISARRQKPRLAKLLRKLCNSFCEGYRQRAGLKCSMRPEDPNSQIYRSALLLSGRDIINYANDACLKDESFDEMVKTGLWYLEVAGDDMNDFLREANRAILKDEDEALVQSLFTFK